MSLRAFIITVSLALLVFGDFELGWHFTHNPVEKSRDWVCTQVGHGTSIREPVHTDTPMTAAQVETLARRYGFSLDGLPINCKADTI